MTTPDHDTAPASEPEEQETGLQRGARFADMFSEFLSPRVVGALLAALVLAVVALTGGLSRATAEAHEEPAAQATPGQAVEAAPIRVVVGKALQGDAIPGVLERQDDRRYVIVSATLTNLTDEWLDGQGVAGALSGFRTFRTSFEGITYYGQDWEAEKVPPRVYRVQDANQLDALQPGLEQQVILVWEQRRTSPAPTSLVLSVRSLTQRTSSLDGTLGWFDPTPAAEVRLDVRPIPEK